MKNKLRGKSVILGVAGSIAAYKSCDIISGLIKSGVDVDVVMTRYAKKFITPLTLRTISGREVYTDMFKERSYQPGHIQLADRADLIVIAPASADVIAKITCGIADDLLTSVVLAANKPIILAPAMNEGMYNNRVTQDNIKKLKARGFILVAPEKGRLASGAIGIGRLADTLTIIKKAEEQLLLKST